MATDILMNNSDDIRSSENISSQQNQLSSSSASSSSLILDSAHSSKQGKRPRLEDAIVSISNFKVPLSKCTSGEHALYAVFDGHGDDSVANACIDYLPKILSQCLEKFDNINQALNECIMNLDQTVINNVKNSKRAGAVAIITLIDIKENLLWVTNVGDARCIIISSNKNVQALSKEHRPDMNESELQRITNAGGFVGPRGYVMNVLQMTRCIGDNDVKQVNPNVIICKPDIKTYKLSEDDKYLILGCDGLWDVLTNSDVEHYIMNHLSQKSNITLQQLSDNLTSDAIQKYKSMDNVSVIIVQLHNLDKNDLHA